MTTIYWLIMTEHSGIFLTPNNTPVQRLNRSETLFIVLRLTPLPKQKLIPIPQCQQSELSLKNQQPQLVW